MKRLIVNADDFGLHEDINKGIIKGFREGFITSASIMPGAPAFAGAAELARANPRLGIGIHLTLVGGVAPVLPPEKVPSLVDGRGVFLPDYMAFSRRFYSGGVKKAELMAELRAQIEKALAARLNLNITHLDSHQHTHVLPIINSFVVQLCREYQIKKIRIPKEPYFFSGGFSAGVGRKIGRAGLSFCSQLAAGRASAAGLRFPDCFFGMLAGGSLTPALVGNILRALPEGTSELMTHPGLNAAALGRQFSWGYHWESELSAYLDAGNKKLLKERQINLISFGEL